MTALFLHNKKHKIKPSFYLGFIQSAASFPCISVSTKQEKNAKIPYVEL